MTRVGSRARCLVALPSDVEGLRGCHRNRRHNTSGCRSSAAVCRRRCRSSSSPASSSPGCSSRRPGPRPRVARALLGAAGASPAARGHARARGGGARLVVRAAPPRPPRRRARRRRLFSTCPTCASPRRPPTTSARSPAEPGVALLVARRRGAVLPRVAAARARRSAAFARRGAPPRRGVGRGAPPAPRDRACGAGSVVPALAAPHRPRPSRGRSSGCPRAPGSSALGGLLAIGALEAARVPVGVRRAASWLWRCSAARVGRARRRRPAPTPARRRCGPVLGTTALILAGTTATDRATSVPRLLAAWPMRAPRPAVLLVVPVALAGARARGGRLGRGGARASCCSSRWSCSCPQRCRTASSRRRCATRPVLVASSRRFAAARSRCP